MAALRSILAAEPRASTREVWGGAAGETGRTGRPAWWEPAPIAGTVTREAGGGGAVAGGGLPGGGTITGGTAGPGVRLGSRCGSLAPWRGGARVGDREPERRLGSAGSSWRGPGVRMGTERGDRTDPAAWPGAGGERMTVAGSSPSGWKPGLSPKSVPGAGSGRSRAPVCLIPWELLLREW